MRKNLKKAREAKKLTQEKTAEYLDISSVYYNSIERGKESGSLELWKKIEDLFGIDWTVLWRNHN